MFEMESGGQEFAYFPSTTVGGFHTLFDRCSYFISTVNVMERYTTILLIVDF